MNPQNVHFTEPIREEWSKRTFDNYEGGREKLFDELEERKASQEVQLSESGVKDLREGLQELLDGGSNLGLNNELKRLLNEDLINQITNPEQVEKVVDSILGDPRLEILDKTRAIAIISLYLQSTFGFEQRQSPAYKLDHPAELKRLEIPTIDVELQKDNKRWVDKSILETPAEKAWRKTINYLIQEYDMAGTPGWEAKYTKGDKNSSEYPAFQRQQIAKETLTALFRKTFEKKPKGELVDIENLLLLDMEFWELAHTLQQIEISAEIPEEYGLLPAGTVDRKGPAPDPTTNGPERDDFAKRIKLINNLKKKYGGRIINARLLKNNIGSEKGIENIGYIGVLIVFYKIPQPDGSPDKILSHKQLFDEVASVSLEEIFETEAGEVITMDDSYERSLKSGSGVGRFEVLVAENPRYKNATYIAVDTIDGTAMSASAVIINPDKARGALQQNKEAAMEQINRNVRRYVHNSERMEDWEEDIDELINVLIDKNQKTLKTLK